MIVLKGASLVTSQALTGSLILAISLTSSFVDTVTLLIDSVPSSFSRALNKSRDGQRMSVIDCEMLIIPF